MNSFDQVEPEGQEEYHPIETSPFIDEDGKKICGNENWNRCIDSFQSQSSIQPLRNLLIRIQTV